MLANLHCQLDYQWNELKHKLLVIPVKAFLKQIIWSSKTHHECGLHLLVTAQRKGLKRGNIAFSCWQAHLSRCRDIPSLMLEPTPLVYQHE